MPRCGEALVGLLEQYGIDTVFGIPGVHTLELYRGLKNTSIRHITPRHEQGAGFMADGYARASGRVAACFIITGPGMTNIATAMGQALADSIPMLVISSVNQTGELGMGEGRLHELPHQRNLVSGVSRFSHTLLRAQNLPKVLARAFAVFHCERPGPVHIEIPIDVLTAEVENIEETAFPLPSVPGPDADAILNASEMLNNSQSALIVAGGGSIGAATEIRQLAERLDIPVVNTVNARGVIPGSHMLAAGGSPSNLPVREAIEKADVVLAVGTELGETDFDYFAKGGLELTGSLVRIDIEAQQLMRGVRPALAICSDARLAMQALLQKVPARQAGGVSRAKALREQQLELRNQHYQNFFAAIRSALPEVVIAGDSTQPTYHAYLHYDTEQPRKYFHSASGYGTLGYAIPAAIGARLAMPDVPVIGLIGDGAAQFSIAEIACAVENRLNVVFLIWNNSGYREIKQFMLDNDVPTIGVDIHAPDFISLGKSFGCIAQAAGSLDELTDSLRESQGREGPTLIEVRQSDIAPDES